MPFITTQQAKLDLELVPKEKRLEIGKCNRRLNPGKIQREPTFEVVLDPLALTPCYSAFLITADDPAEGSSSLSLSFRFLFNEYRAARYDSLLSILSIEDAHVTLSIVPLNMLM
ncbi:hypothetical protein Tco_0900871 [Tanacetum coccineum]